MAHQLADTEMQSSVKGDGNPSPILTRVQMYSSLTNNKKKNVCSRLLAKFGISFDHQIIMQFKKASVISLF